MESRTKIDEPEEMEMEDHEEMHEPEEVEEGGVAAATGKPARLSPAEFIEEFRRIGRGADLIEPLEAFKPFWTTIRQLCRATSGSQPVLKPRKWRLKPQRLRSPTPQEIEARAALLVNRAMLQLEPLVRRFSSDPTVEATLARVAFTFCQTLHLEPSSFASYSRQEIKSLEATARIFAPEEDLPPRALSTQHSTNIVYDRA